MNKSVITIDGPAASGKGSLSKKISKEFNFFIWKLVFITEVCKLILQKSSKYIRFTSFYF